MKLISIVLFLCLFLSQTKAQQNVLLKPDDLLQRIQNGKDTVFIINFWATWCGPCVKELPNFEKLSAVYKTDKLKVLLISVDFRSQLDNKLLPFLHRKKMKNEVYLLDEKDQQAYIEKIDPSWSGAIPASLFIKGNRRMFTEREFSYTALMNEYLKFKQ